MLDEVAELHSACYSLSVCLNFERVMSVVRVRDANLIVFVGRGSVTANLPQLKDQTMSSLGTMVTVMLIQQYNQ